MNAVRYKLYMNNTPLPGMFLLPAAQEMAVRLERFFPSVRVCYRCERATV